jgi:hypothetical protein
MLRWPEPARFCYSFYDTRIILKGSQKSTGPGSHFWPDSSFAMVGSKALTLRPCRGDSFCELINPGRIHRKIKEVDRPYSKRRHLAIVYAVALLFIDLGLPGGLLAQGKMGTENLSESAGYVR